MTVARVSVSMLTLMKKWFIVLSTIALIAVMMMIAYKKAYKNLGSTVDSKTEDEMLEVTSDLVRPTIPFRTDYVQEGGFVLSHDYCEQLTSATRNLELLQCWASKTDISWVVEPFISGTSFRSPPKEQEKNSLHFSDMYNIDHWNDMSRNKHYPLVVSWEDFIKSAPRNLILVNIGYASPCMLAEKDRTSRQGCSVPNSLLDFVKTLEEYNFKVVREVCFDFSHSRQISRSNFHNQIYHDDDGLQHPSANSTVLFSEWRGFSDNRIRVLSVGCGIQTATMKTTLSKNLIRDAESYIEKYLSSTHGYVAVVLRIEKAKQIRQQSPDYCFQQTLEYWKKMVRDTGINATFLSTDIGKFGSKSFDDSDKTELFSSFFNTLYSSKSTIGEWEATFEGISAHHGYIGELQKVIASYADCVLFTGGGSFQRNLLKLYRQRNPKKECVYIVKSCLGDKLS